jgi:hypothetical protein
MKDNQVSYMDGPSHEMQHSSVAAATVHIQCTNLKLHEHMIIEDRGVDDQYALEAMQRAQQLTQLYAAQQRTPLVEPIRQTK